MVIPRATRVIRLALPLDLAATLGAVRRGGIDPCMRLWAGECWRATRTPEGPTTLHLRHHGNDVVTEAWGDGADWMLEHVPVLLGLHDDVVSFDPRIPLLADLEHRPPGLRIGRTRAVAEALAPTVIEQRVTSSAAHRSWASLVWRFGERAPGPADVFLPPAPDVLARLPVWTFHRADIDGGRARTIAFAMSRACRLEETTSMAMPDSYRRLLAFPGVGQWTAAEVARVALGDPDAVSVGDFHLKNQVAWALAGEPRGTDEHMLELLEPWRGQRARVLQLLAAGGIGAPLLAPKRRVLSIAAI
jgi:3-methyladenine DNA glycosylase/8-oxoguanine DNA glycosylase